MQKNRKYARLKYDKPFIKRGERKSGVYKILFDEKWFYIGSSGNLRGRFMSWVSRIKQGRRLNTNMVNILSKIKSVKIVIIEHCLCKEDALLKEDFYIKQTFKNEFSLNHQPSALNLRDRELYKGFIKPIKQKGISVLPKKVAQIDDKGNIINIFPSIRSAKKSGFVNVSEVINGKNITSKGYKFRMMDSNGSVIDFDRRRNTSYFKSEKHKIVMKAYYDKIKASPEWDKYKKRCHNKSQLSKKIIAIRIDGTGISEYESLNDAARQLNLEVSNIRKVIKGQRQQTKGYIFKLAS